MEYIKIESGSICAFGNPTVAEKAELEQKGYTQFLTAKDGEMWILCSKDRKDDSNG